MKIYLFKIYIFLLGNIIVITSFNPPLDCGHSLTDWLPFYSLSIFYEVLSLLELKCEKIVLVLPG